MTSHGARARQALAFVCGMGVVLAAGGLMLADREDVFAGRESPGRAVAAAPAPPPALAGDRIRAPREVLALGRPDSLRFRFEKSPPRAGLLFDLETGEVLWRRRPRERLPIASLTKIMSALQIVSRTRPGDQVRITRRAIDFSGSAVGLPRGKRAPVESLLAAMLIQSGNDASLALAIGTFGSVRAFVDRMNERARVLGLRCSRFVSPHGLEPRNRSCAADVAVLSRLAMEEPRIARIVGRNGTAVPFPIKGGQLHLAPTNPLLRTGYPGTIGLKTGYTGEAGRSLVAVVHREGRTLGAVLIDSPDPAVQARKLFDKVFGEPPVSPSSR